MDTDLTSIRGSEGPRAVEQSQDLEPKTAPVATPLSETPNSDPPFPTAIVREPRTLTLSASSESLSSTSTGSSISVEETVKRLQNTPKKAEIKEFNKEVDNFLKEMKEWVAREKPEDIAVFTALEKVLVSFKKEISSADDLSAAKATLKNWKTWFTSVKIDRLAEGAFYQIAAGKAKEVYLRKVTDETHTSGKGYVFIKALGGSSSKQEEIAYEVKMGAELAAKFKDGQEKHFVEYTVVTDPAEKIKGAETVKTPAAAMDAEKLMRSGNIKFPQSLNVAKQFAQVTADFHRTSEIDGREVGHIQGDMKPENYLVFYDKDKNIQIKGSDYGKTKRIGPTEVITGRGGNPRFAAPEGSDSMSGEIYSLHMLIVRTLESELLTEGREMLLDPPQGVNRSSKPIIGYEKYMVNNELTAQSDSLLGRVSALKTATLGQSKTKLINQSEQSQLYIEELFRQLTEKYGDDPTKVDCLINLQNLLNRMASPNPSRRPTASQVVEALELIEKQWPTA